MRLGRRTFFSTIIIKLGTVIVVFIILTEAIKEGGHFREDGLVVVVEEVALPLDQVICGCATGFEHRVNPRLKIVPLGIGTQQSFWSEFLGRGKQLVHHRIY
ncbi:hypothetical protein D3C80_1731960 [compost metagenome]